ncbi:MAG: hypothetical protein RI563_00760 [Thiohalophilus sp.]|uniref:hypothetical protein n=1 Tax=Thiohalophilus sp. TaxID=3028392 RepID=UPI0028703A55|nr:hypothetical protein [Thiohalophilus sp.]MDR9435376.1 hypothetical protein [Thiohalophilus sp.]
MSSVNLTKASLHFLGSSSDLPEPFIFQFNPESITRVQNYSEKNSKITETIRLHLVFNIMHGLSDNNPQAIEHGIYPLLAALEEYVTEQSKLTRLPGILRKMGPKIQRVMVLSYGKRSIPVRIVRLNIKELVHNAQLTPLHATVDLSLRVLSESELNGNPRGKAALDNYRKYRESEARLLTPLTHLE